MSSARTALRERVAALGRARRALAAGRVDEAEAMLREELDRWPGNRDAQALLAEVTRARGGTPGVRPGGRVRDVAPKVRPSSTEAWSSFEQRIRERRIAKCTEHAHAAIDAGDATAALASIDEIGTLVPGHPVLDELEAMLREHGIDARPARGGNERPVSLAPRQEDVRRDPPTVGVDEPSRASRDSTLDLGDTARMDDAAPLAPPSTLHEAVHFIEPLAPPTEVIAPDALNDPLELFDEPATNPMREAFRADDMRPVAAPDDLRPSEARLPASWESAPPLRERGTHVLGILLVVLSVLALSGWLGYRLFSPVGDVPLVPAADKVADASGGSASPAHPPADAQETPALGDPTGTVGRDDGRAALPSPDTQSKAQSATPPTPRLTSPPTSTTTERSTTTPSTDARSSSNERRTEETAPSGEPSTTGATSAAPQAAPPQSPSAPEPQAPVGGQPPAPASQSPPPGNTEAPPVPVPAPAEPVPPARSEPAPASPPPAPSASTTPGAGDSTETSPQDAEALRGLIEGYVAGYNNLDAGGVRSVWPRVDQRALARAFNQLRSQRLAFSRCEVRASGDTGHGFCTGRATWRPRVGGGERTEPRVWRFDFAQRSGQWSIEKVGVER